jgi:ribosomal protein S18 acetylase RimI-like enzyme
MNTPFKPLSPDGLPTLLELMREFYPQQRMSLDEKAAVAAAESMVNDPALGAIYLIAPDRCLAGYFVLTFCYSLEFHGWFGLLDEIYIRPAFQRQGLGRSAIAFAQEICKKAEIKALRLEVCDENAGAQRLYRRAGFEQDARFLFTKWL